MGALDTVRSAAPKTALDRLRSAPPSVDPAVPQPRQPLVQIPELPQEIKDIQNQGADLHSSIRYQVGLDADPQGQYPGKHAAMVERGAVPDAIPITERSYPTLAKNTVTNFIPEARSILAGIGTAMVRGARGAAQSIAGTALDALKYVETGDAAPLAQDAQTAGTVVLGAGTTALDAIRDVAIGNIGRFAAPVDAGLQARGLLVPNAEVTDKYADRTAVHLPGTQRSIVPRKMAEFVSEHPATAALDLSMLAATPGIVARGGGEAAIRAGGALERLGVSDATRAAAAAGGPVPLNAAERAGAKLAQAGVAAQDTGEALRELHPLSLARRGAANLASRTEMGRDALNWAGAHKVANDLINREANRSVGLRIADQEDYAAALKPLVASDAKNADAIAKGLISSDQARAVSILEGRAFPLPTEKPAVIDAVRLIREKEIAKRRELILAGVLKPSQAADRALAPWVNQQTGKRIPQFGATDAEIKLRNAKLEPGEALWLTPTEYRSEVAKIRTFQKDWNAIPEHVKFEPVYFPRFETGAPDAMVRRKVAGEFFPKRGTSPGRQTFEKHYSGLSYLRNADPTDVQEALFRYNAQSRKVIDSNQIVRNLLEGEMDVRKPGGVVVREKIAKPLKLDKNGNPLRNADGTSTLLPGYRPYAPDGMNAYYRAQVDMVDAVARKLETMADPGKDIADAVRQALPQPHQLNKAWLGVSKRRNIYQIPEAVAKQVDHRFAETPMAAKLFDKGTDAWKAGVLVTSPRWYINNFVGNLLMELMAGGNPARVANIVRKGSLEEKAIATEIRSRGFGVNEGFRRNLGMQQGTATARAMAAAADAPVIKQIGSLSQFGFDMNQVVDNHFRQNLYLDIGRKEARNALIKRTGRAYFDSRQTLLELGKMSSDRVASGRLLKKLDSVFVNFNNLTPVERQVFRRIVPFWSWYREIARITVSLPKRSPVRTQMARFLSGMARDADAKEFQDQVGFPKTDLRKYAELATFMSYNPDTREIQQMSTQGVNPYEQALTPDFSMLHPALQMATQEAFGGRTMGGAFVPFRTLEGAKDGEVGPKPGFALRVARSAFPPLRAAEDAAQQATEGIVSQRYEDLSPLANAWRKYVTKEGVYNTAVYDQKTRLPRRVKPIGDTAKSMLAVPVQRLLSNEAIEQKKKEEESAANRWSNNAFRDPADQAALDRALREHAGESSAGGWWHSDPLPGK